MKTLSRIISLLIVLVAVSRAQNPTFWGMNYTASGGGSQAATPPWSPGTSPIYAGVAITATSSCSTPSSYICYTRTGVTPVPNGAGGCTTGTLYGGGFAVTTAETDKAICAASGYSNSNEADQTFTLSTQVANWQMADGSGTTATDSCCGDNLTITPGSGGWSTQTGVANGVYSFDGSTTVMKAANNTNFNFNYNQPFSVFCVVNITSNSADQECAGDLDTGNNYRGWELLLNYSSGNYGPMFFLINTYPSNVLQVGPNTPYSMSPGTLYDVLVTYNGNHTSGGVAMYINGVVLSSYNVIANSLTTTTTNSKTTWVGSRQDGSVPFKGKRGPARIWNRVLTSAEATTLHANFYAAIN